MAQYGTSGDWSKDTLPGPVRVGEGRTAVRLELVPQGRDLLLLIGGGQTHVGAVAVARPGAAGGAAGSVVIPPHKEGPLAAECAALLAEAAGCACAAAAGIHQDDATPAEIAAICANVRAAAGQLAAAVAAGRTAAAADPLEVLLAGWAREAGALALEHWRGGAALAFKAGREAVTAADPAIERLLRARIAAAFPGDAVVGEELGGQAPPRGRVWHLDPIDGTLNFALGLPGFCTSIALWEDGRPLAACIHVPVGGDTFIARRGAGARRNGRPIAVSGRARLADAVVSGQFKPDGRFVRDPALLQALLRRTLKVRKVGAIALELAWVAAGGYDALVAGFGQRIEAWDVAAGLLLVTEAGGRVSDLGGRPYQAGGADLVASNGLVHDELCALVGCGA